jgi:1,4-alpha-glucan branching enzyme
MNDRAGAFTLVLHAHIPYVRAAGRWPHGEEWVLEAATDTYIPLLRAFHDLAAASIPVALTFEITPVLAEQLADDDVRAHLDDYIADLHARAQADVSRFSRDGDSTREAVARFYVEHYAGVQAAYRDRFGRDLIGAMRALQDGGGFELATSGATHGYLPLFERDSSIFAQIAQGMRTHERLFGRRAESFWLPECAYRPQMDGRPGLERFLADEGVRVFFADTHMLGEASPYAAHHVGASRVAVLARNQTALRQAWSKVGYPGDAVYREFTSRDSESGHRYWRITGADTPLSEKALYDPAAASALAGEHARHFVSLVEQELSAYRASSGRYGVMTALYDAELFGHWWFEGVNWIEQVLRGLAASRVVDLTGAARFVAEHPPEASIALRRGSWGVDGNDVTWQNGHTSWMWPIVDAAQRRIEPIVAAAGAVDQEMTDARRQLARELLLLESSDWPYLVTTGQAAAYAERRFTQHAERFDALAAMIESGAISASYVAGLAARDNPFPDIDITDYRPRT